MTCRDCKDAYRDDKLATLELCFRRINNVLTHSNMSGETLSAQRANADDMKRFEAKWDGAKCTHQPGPYSPDFKHYDATHVRNPVSYGGIVDVTGPDAPGSVLLTGGGMETINADETQRPEPSGPSGQEPTATAETTPPPVKRSPGRPPKQR